jgi:hypothetical protein
MKSKILISILAFFFLINIVSAAADVAYIVPTLSDVKSEFVDAMNDLGLTHNVIYSDSVSSVEFEGNYSLILLNDNSFPNWDEIPINDFPALVVNGRNVDDWGWTKRITSSSSEDPIHVDLNEGPLTTGLGDNIQVYTLGVTPDVYYMHKDDIFQGFEIVAGNTFDNENAVVALAREGTVLTKTGQPDTIVNANSIFFGITEAEYWTADAEQLFKNALGWLMQVEASYDLELNEGWNLVSCPITLESNDLTDILALNPEIVSVKEYDPVLDNLIEATEMHNNYGYFIQSTISTNLILNGYEPMQSQGLDLVEGINLVGITSLDSGSFTDFNLPSEVIEVSRRNPDGTYDVARKYFGFWFNDFDLEPGRGYWFKTNGGVTWTYTP